MSWDKLSPDVEAIMGAGDRRQQDRHLTPAQKRERSRQAERVRVTIDMPDWLKDELLKLADQEQTSASSAASFFIARCIRAVRRGKLHLPKRPSDSPRFEFLVEVTEADADL
jgi:hypothetical protein